jgi:hypothetical protein
VRARRYCRESPIDPLLTKRKLRKRERIVKVWTRNTDDQKQPLYFETDDGEFWQLCELGLGWTSQTDRRGLVEEMRFFQWLPANIEPRPPVTAPWTYEFQLAHGASFYVRSGSDTGTHQWGIRLPQPDPVKS